MNIYYKNMARNIVVTLRLDDRSLKEIRGVPLGNIFSGMEALAQQPPLEVSERYRNKEN